MAPCVWTQFGVVIHLQMHRKQQTQDRRPEVVPVDQTHDSLWLIHELTYFDASVTICIGLVASKCTRTGPLVSHSHS